MQGCRLPIYRPERRSNGLSALVVADGESLSCKKPSGVAYPLRFCFVQRVGRSSLQFSQLCAIASDTALGLAHFLAPTHSFWLDLRTLYALRRITRVFRN